MSLNIPTLAAASALALTSSTRTQEADALLQAAVWDLHEGLMAEAKRGLFPIDRNTIETTPPETSILYEGYGIQNSIEYTLSNASERDQRRLERIAKQLVNEMNKTRSDIRCVDFGAKDGSSLGMGCMILAPFEEAEKAALFAKAAEAEQIAVEGAKQCIDGEFFNGFSDVRTSLASSTHLHLGNGQSAPMEAPYVYGFGYTQLSGDPDHRSYAATQCLKEAISVLSFPEGCEASISIGYAKDEGIRNSDVSLHLQCDAPGPFTNLSE